MCTSRTRRASGSTRPRRRRSTGRSPCATRSSGTPSPSCATTPTRRSPRSRSRRQHGPLPRRQSSIDSSVYPDLAEFWADLTGAYAQELQGLYDLGARYIQLDDTSLAYVNDPEQRKHITDIGGDPEHLHEQYIANMNRSLAGRPDDLRITTHLCRGNNQSMWAAEGGYDFVAEALFGDLNVDGYFLEFDDERSGGFEPLRYVPEGKYVVLGLVTTKKPQLENKDELKRRIEEASKYVPLDQLCLSPQRGSPRPRRATSSPRTTRRPSSRSSSRPPRRSGARPTG
jgi:methionine synthase II (cobalamin-independent)